MKRLTEKEKKFVETYAKNGGNVTKAALKAYKSKTPKQASSIASTKLKKPKIQDALEKELKAQKITLKKALSPIADALNDADIEVRLKGSDRALKLLLPKDKPESNLSFNLNIDSAHFGGEFVIEGETTDE